MEKLELDTPAAILDLSILERNISDMADFAKHAGVRLRPHIKTHKVPEIALKQLESGASGITCAKIGEAEVMSAVASDIFIANLIVGNDKIRRLLNLARRLEKLSVGVDSVAVAAPLSDAANGAKIPVLIKIDTGLKRTGVPHGLPALDLAQKLDRMKGLELIGIYTHEGHVYGAPDRESVESIGLGSGQRMAETAELLRRSGFNIEVVSVGATPSAKVTCTVPGITETRPGTYVFDDYFQMRLGAANEEDCALTILTTVISVPEPERAVIDAGTKSLMSEKVKDFGVYGLVKGLPHVRLVRASEEHGVLQVDPSKGRLKVGDKIEIIPNHVCPVVNLFDELVGLRNGVVETTWKVAARGKAQ